MLAAAIGGAVAGALLNTVFYSVSCENSGNKATIGGAVLAFVTGGITGAIGGAAGITADAVFKGLGILSAGAISGLYCYFTGGSGLWGIIGGSLGAYWGTLFSTCGFTGFALGVAVYASSVATGMAAEGVSQLGQAIFPEDDYETDPTPESPKDSLTVGQASNSTSSRSSARGGFSVRPITIVANYLH